MVAGAPAGSPGNVRDWIVGTVADLPPTVGDVVKASFAREPEIIDFLSQRFGRYPFSASGGIVDDVEGLGFALENQTRPIYARDFFTDEASGASVIVHELAHQWFGDSLAVDALATHLAQRGLRDLRRVAVVRARGRATPQESPTSTTPSIPADDPFWSLTIGDPGPEHLFDSPVYAAGRLTLHQLRLTIGDDKFFRLLRTWAQNQRGWQRHHRRSSSRLPSRSPGRTWTAFFDTWLFTGTKPDSRPHRRPAHWPPGAARPGSAAAALMKRLAATR